MRLHFVGASKSAFYGLASSMAALCTDNCTSRVWQNLKYIAEKNVSYGGYEYSKRFLADVPEKRGELWLGCVSAVNGTPVSWIRPRWGARAGLISEDWNTLWNYDRPERTFGRKSFSRFSTDGRFGDWWKPYFKVWNFNAFPGNTAELEYGRTQDSSVFTELRNSKINLRHKDETRTICNLVNRWELCGFLPVAKLSFGNEYISSFLAPVNNGLSVHNYYQSDTVSGLLPGYRPFSFIPKTGDTPIVLFPTFGIPWYQTGVGFRTDFVVDISLVNGNQRIQFDFKHEEFRRINQIGFGEYWIKIVNASGTAVFTVPVCEDDLQFTMPILVTKYYQGRVDQVSTNCILNLSYAFL